MENKSAATPAARSAYVCQRRELARHSWMKTGPNPKCMTDLRCRPALWVNLMALAYRPRQLSARECRCYHDFREMGTRPKFVRFGEAVSIPAGRAFFARFDSAPRPSRPNNQ